MRMHSIIILILIGSFFITNNYYCQEIKLEKYSYRANNNSEIVSSNYVLQASVGRSIVGTARQNNKVIMSSLPKHFLFETVDKLGNHFEFDSPIEYSLSQNYPNPFNPSTIIKYSIPDEAHVNLTIFNLLGERVIELVDEVKSPGVHEVVWNAQSLSNGIYVYKIISSNYSDSKKLILLK